MNDIFISTSNPIYGFADVNTLHSSSQMRWTGQIWRFAEQKASPSPVTFTPSLSKKNTRAPQDFVCQGREWLHGSYHLLLNKFQWVKYITYNCIHYPYLFRVYQIFIVCRVLSVQETKKIWKIDTNNLQTYHSQKKFPDWETPSIKDGQKSRVKYR